MEAEAKLTRQLHKILGIENLLKEPIATVERTDLNINQSRYSLPRNYRNQYSFNISGVNTVREDCVVYMGHYFAILTPKTTMASKYRDGSN